MMLFIGTSLYKKTKKEPEYYGLSKNKQKEPAVAGSS